MQLLRIRISERGLATTEVNVTETAAQYKIDGGEPTSRRRLRKSELMVPGSAISRNGVTYRMTVWCLPEDKYAATKALVAAISSALARDAERVVYAQLTLTTTQRAIAEVCRGLD